MASYYTLIHHFETCPQWDDPVVISGKYYYLDDPDNPYLARFVKAECEILENLKLPPHKRKKRFEIYPFCNVTDCPLLTNFEQIVDVRY